MIAGIGIDIVDIARVRGIIGKQGDRFIRRIFTASEQEYCLKHRDPAPYFAARFAAKEAAFKALATGWSQGVTWLDVEIQRSESGAPNLVMTGRALEVSRATGVTAVHVSLSHAEQAAVALVILEKPEE